jgi:predicted nucleotidyltransferase
MRRFDAHDLLSAAQVRAILRDSRALLQAHVDRANGFGFVFGGFAKGYATASHDIDLFVCLRRLDEQSITDIRRDYFLLHERHSLQPDNDDPAEIMSIDQLQARLALATGRPLRPVIETYEEYEAICWAEIIVGAVAEFVGDSDLFFSLREQIAHLPQKWRVEVLNLMPPPIEVEVAKLSILRLLKVARRRGYLHYAKQ